MNDDKSVREQARRLAHKIRTMDQGYVTLDEATAKVEKVLEPLLAAKAEAWQVADALAEALKKAQEWSAKFPLKHPCSHADCDASEDVYDVATSALALHSEAKR